MFSVYLHNCSKVALITHNKQDKCNKVANKALKEFTKAQRLAFYPNVTKHKTLQIK